MNKKIGNIGEFDLLKKIIFPIIKNDYSGTIGDDAAEIEFPDSKYDMIVTTDGPITPLVYDLGLLDFYFHGWYSVLNNVSDLAAVGSKPVCYCSSIKLPTDLSVNDVKRLFKGIADGCKKYSIKNAGGNLKEGSKVECHGTAIGIAKKGRKIGRSGCKPGDILVSIGSINGFFGHCYLKAKRDGLKSLKPKEYDALCKPVAKVREMTLLQQEGFISAASDNSDGILGSLQNICDSSKCSIYLNLDNSSIDPEVIFTAQLNEINPFNLFFFWGDWQIVASINKDVWAHFVLFCKNKKIQFTPLGTAKKGRPVLYGKSNNKFRLMNSLRNENFTSYSFNRNPTTNIDYLLKSPLFL